MADSLKDLPEFFEHDLGESLRARTEALASFRELGPPDLCHIIKATSKPPIKEVGSYHYVSGVDASSSASLAAYINSLQYLTDEQQGWFSKNIGWRIRSGIYCCYNAFARVDVRVEVKIPGGVESHVVDMKGERHEARPDVWEEAYISGIIRSFAYSDDSAYRLAGYRKLDPVPNLKAEKRMLEAASQLFWKGWLFGTEPEYQISSAVSNHMVFGLMKYFTDSHRYEAAAEFFKPLCDKDPEIAAFLARAYFGADEETKAIQVLYDALSKNPMSYVLIHAQVDFLKEKNRPDLALELAKQAVKCSPSEFVAWAKLTEIYIGLGEYESALLTLNSCPMFTFNEKDMHRMPPPARTHFPIKAELQNVSGFDDDASMNEVQQSLLRLPAPTLRGTFAQAYVLLTQLVEKIGWDELLRRRSLVFVMEEEYRLQKAQEEERFSSSGERSSENHGKKHLDSLLGEVGNREHDEGKMKAAMVKIAKPETAQQTSEEKEGEGDEEPSVRSNEPSDLPEEENFSFSNKRLCERWLDNLFMVLYDDLRAYTIWRAEATHFKAQNVAYRKNPAEWEILGDLALRLHNKEEALEAYYLCLESRFSPRAHQRTLELNAEAGHIQPSLGSIVKLAVYQDRWYHDMVYPSPVAENLFRLIRRHGQSKVHNALISMSLPQAMQKLVNRYFTYAETFRIEGSQA